MPRKEGEGKTATAAEKIKGLLTILTAAYLFLFPFPLTSLEEMIFYLALGLLAVGMFLKPEGYSFASSLNWPFLIFGLWSLLGVFFSLDPGGSIKDLYGQYLKYLLLYYLIINAFSGARDLRRLIWLLVISATLFSLGLGVYFYGIRDNEWHFRMATGTGLGEYTTGTISVILVSAAVLALGGLAQERGIVKKSFLSFAFGISLITGVFLPQVRGALIGFLVALAIIFVGRRKKAFLLLFVAVAAMAYALPIKERLDPRALLGDERIPITLVTWEMIKDRPVFGIGFGMQIYENPALLKPYYERLPERFRIAHTIGHPHNFILDIAVRTGIPGLFLFLWIILTYAVMGYQVIRGPGDQEGRLWAYHLLGAMAAVLIEGLVAPFLFGMTAGVVFILFGLMTILWRSGRRDLPLRLGSSGNSRWFFRDPPRER